MSRNLCRNREPADLEFELFGIETSARNAPVAPREFNVAIARPECTLTSMSGSQVLTIGATRIGRTAVELPDGLAVRHDPRQLGDVPLDQPAPLADVDLELADAPMAEAPLLRDGQRLGPPAIRAVEDLGDVQELPPAAPGAA